MKKPSHDSDGKYAKNHDSKHKLPPLRCNRTRGII